jgi:hypothetical protein
MCTVLTAGFRYGTETDPIAAANAGSIVFAAPVNGSATSSRFRAPIGNPSASTFSGKGSSFIYGEVPALRDTQLISDAAVGQAHLNSGRRCIELASWGHSGGW